VTQKINILLVDDHAVVRAGYKTYLSLSENIGEIYEADRGKSLASYTINISRI
jgi:hypothetical protein